LTDWLGTKRVEVGANPCATAYTSLPFGDSLPPASVSGFSACQDDATENHFTGKERDPETGEANGNDYFGARYYASSMGRFMSPDWSATVEPVPYSKLDDPQSLNLYAYMLNNPLGGVDPDGHCGVGPSDPCTASQQACIDMGKCDPGSLKAQQTDTQAQQQMGQDPTLPTAEAPPLLSNQDIAGLKTGTEFALTVGVPEVGELGVAGKALSEAGELEKAGEALLTRYGTKVESTLEKLAGDAAKAEEKIGIHGVSTTSMPKPTLPGGSAPMSAVQKAFNVFKTAGPGHFTVELPKPVTDAVVQIFNSLFFK
jgi:RHS repeat-associated protein